MKKIILLLTVLLIGLSLSGCASQDNADYENGWEDSGYDDENTNPEEPAPTTNDPVLEGGDVVQTAAIPALATRKIIYSAELEMRVEDPEAAYSSIIADLDTYTAYVESANIETDQYIFKIRVLSDNFDDLVEAIKQGGELVHFLKTSEDITNSYSTFQGKLDSLEAQHERILELIDVATDLDTILTLEETRQEIEAELNHIGDILANYDSLVDYSTIDVTIKKATEEIIILPRTEMAQLNVIEIGKNGTQVEIYNTDEAPVVINMDLYQNGEFVREYEETSLGEAKTNITMTDLESFTEYTLKLTVIADEHRISQERTIVFETEKTFINRVENVFITSYESLVSVLEFAGLVVVALLPYTIIAAIIFIPVRILKKKGFLDKWTSYRTKKKAIKQAKKEQRRQEYEKQQAMYRRKEYEKKQKKLQAQQNNNKTEK